MSTRRIIIVRPHLRWLLPALVLAAFILVLPEGRIAVATSPRLPVPTDSAVADWNDVEFVVVTTQELLPAFARLADWRSDHGTPATVVTLDWITDVAPPGRDLQETVRNFLVLAHEQWRTRHVLLGGTSALVPARTVRAAIDYPPGEPHLFVSDWYFGCLDGDWDADGDGVFGEYGSDQDDPDLVPELGVGRAPVRSAAEAEVFVDKVIAHELAVGQARIDRALLLAEVLAPWNWRPGDPVTVDGAAIGETVRSVLEAADVPFTVDRRYENCGAYAGADSLSRRHALAALAAGDANYVYHIGHGNAFNLAVGRYPPEQVVSRDDAAALDNGPHHFVLHTLAGNTALEHGDNILAELLRNPEGGAVAAIGRTSFNYFSPTLDLDEAIIDELAAPGQPCLGGALAAAMADIVGIAPASTSMHLALLETVLLGDPALRLRPGAVAAAAGAARVPADVAIRACWPNPFNPRTSIRFEVRGRAGGALPTTVAVHDVAGRRVAVLLDEPLVPGVYARTWDGTDAAGRPVAAGVYLVSVQAGGRQAVEKLVLMK